MATSPRIEWPSSPHDLPPDHFVCPHMDDGIPTAGKWLDKRVLLGWYWLGGCLAQLGDFDSDAQRDALANLTMQQREGPFQAIAGEISPDGHPTLWEMKRFIRRVWREMRRIIESREEETS